MKISLKNKKKAFLRTVLQDLHALPAWAQDTAALFAPASLQHLGYPHSWTSIFILYTS
jgi:hypothetical protein